MQEKPDAACAGCGLLELCAPTNLDWRKVLVDERLVGTVRKVARGEHLFAAGQAFESLYAVCTGFLKTHVSAPRGQRQITGFPMPGDIIGFDGILAGRHTCDAVALEHAEVRVIPYELASRIAREERALQEHLARAMSRALVHKQGVLLLLGTMQAEERVALFLVNLAQRLRSRGFSGTELVLRMTREEVGNFLGLTLETVSRSLSAFAQQRLIAVDHRHVRLLDVQALHRRVCAP